MARGTFDGSDICESLTHWHAGGSKNEIAGSLGLSRNTVRKYVAAAEAAGMVPGGPAVSQERWAELARAWFPELADTRLRQVTWPSTRPVATSIRRAWRLVPSASVTSKPPAGNRASEVTVPVMSWPP